MDLSSFGTGGLVLNKISAMTNLLSGRSTLPSGCGQGGCANHGGYIDPIMRSLIRHLVVPNSGPSDIPIVISYKNDVMSGDFGTEFGTGWYSSFQRLVNSAGGAFKVSAPPNNLVYSTTTTPIFPIPPNVNSLTGSPATGWTETQPNGAAFVYDTNGVLRAMKNPAGVRWTLSWDAGFNLVQHIDSPYGRRTSFTYDANNMIRRIQDPGGRITTFVVNNSLDLVRFITPELCMTSMVYDDNHQLLAWIDSTGARTSYIYQGPDPVTGLGVTAVQLPMGQRTTYTNINLVSSSDPVTAWILNPGGGRTTLTIPGASSSRPNPLPDSSTDVFGDTTH